MSEATMTPGKPAQVHRTPTEAVAWMTMRQDKIREGGEALRKRMGTAKYNKILEMSMAADAADVAEYQDLSKQFHNTWTTVGDDHIDFLEASKGFPDMATRPRVRQIVQGEVDAVTRSATAFSSLRSLFGAIYGPANDAIGEFQNVRDQLGQSNPTLATIVDGISDFRNFHKDFIEFERQLEQQPGPRAGTEAVRSTLAHHPLGQAFRQLLADPSLVEQGTELLLPQISPRAQREATQGPDPNDPWGQIYSLNDYVMKFAPPSENDSTQYALDLASAVGADVDTPFYELDVDQVAQAQAQIEGFNQPGSLAQRNRNPGNLRYAGQPGASKGQGGFAIFPTEQAGWLALKNQIRLDQGRSWLNERGGGPPEPEEGDVQVDEDILDYHNSLVIYEDVMRNRESIAEHGQRALGVPYHQTMKAISEWGNGTRNSLMAAHAGLGFPSFREPQEYAPIGDKDLTLGDRLARGAAETLSFGQPGYGARVAPRSELPELAYGMLPANAVAWTELAGSLAMDIPAVVASFLITPGALATTTGGRGLLALARSTQKVGALNRAKGVFAHGATGGTIYSFLNTHKAPFDIVGKAHDVPLNAILFGTLDVGFVGAKFGATAAARAAGAGVRGIGAGLRSTSRRAGDAGRRVTQSFRRNIVGGQSEGSAPSTAPGATAVERAVGAQPQARLQGPMTPAQERQFAHVFEDVMATWETGMRDSALPAQEIQRIVEEGVLKGMTNDEIYGAFLRSYRDWGPRAPRHLPAAPRGPQEPRGFPGREGELLQEEFVAREARGAARKAGEAGRRELGALERQAPEDLTRTVPEGVIGPVETARGKAQADVRNEGARARRARRKEVRAQKERERIERGDRPARETPQERRTRIGEIVDEAGPFDHIPGSPEGLRRTLRRAEQRATREFEEGVEKGFEGTIEEFHQLPKESQTRIRERDVEHEGIAEVGRTMRELDEALTAIVEGLGKDRSKVRRAVRSAFSQQRVNALRRQLGTSGGRRTAQAIEGTLENGSYRLDRDGLTLELDGRLLKLDNRQLVKWLGDQPPPRQQPRGGPRPKSGERAEPAAAPPEPPPAPTPEPPKALTPPRGRIVEPEAPPPKPPTEGKPLDGLSRQELIQELLDPGLSGERKRAIQAMLAEKKAPPPEPEPTPAEAQVAEPVPPAGEATPPFEIVDQEFLKGLPRAEERPGTIEAAFHEGKLYLDREFVKARPDRLSAAVQHELEEVAGLSHEAAVAVEKNIIAGRGKPSPTAERIAEIATKRIPPDDTRVTTEQVSPHDLVTDVDRFQGRLAGQLEPVDVGALPARERAIAERLQAIDHDIRGLDLDHVGNIAETWSPERYLLGGEIIVWAGPDGKLIIVSGHHRHAAARLVLGPNAKLSVKQAKGMTQAEAEEFALASNRNSKGEGIASDIRAYEISKGQGKSASELKILFPKRVGLLDAYTHLYEHGKFRQSLTMGAEGQHPGLEKFARWTGELRESFEKITNAHENEIFDWVFPRRAQTLDKEGFLRAIESKVQRIDFDPNKPLEMRSIEDIERLAAETNLGEVLQEVRSARESITHLNRVVEDAQTSGEVAKAGKEDIARLRARIDELEQMAIDVKRRQGTLFSRGEADIPDDLAILRRLKMEGEVLVDDALLDAAAEGTYKAEGMMKRALDEENASSIPNTHRGREYADLGKMLGDAREHVVGMIHLASQIGTKTISHADVLAHINAMPGAQLTMMKQIAALAKASNVRPSTVRRILSELAPAGQRLQFEELVLTRDIVERLGARGSFDDETIAKTIREVLEPELTLRGLSEAGYVEGPIAERAWPVMKGKTYGQSGKQFAQAARMTRGEKRAKGLYTSDEGISADIRYTEEFVREMRSTGKIPEREIPRIIADNAYIEGAPGKTGKERLYNALDLIFNPTQSAKRWVQRANFNRIVQPTKPWSLDATDNLFINFDGFMEEFAKAAGTRAHFVNNSGAIWNRIHGFLGGKWIGGRLLPDRMIKPPKGMAKTEFSTRRSMMDGQLIPEDHFLSHAVTRLLETQSGNVVGHRAVIEGIKEYLRVNPKYGKRIDAESLVAIARDIRTNIFNEQFPLLEQLGATFRENYVPRIFRNVTESGRYRVSDHLLGGEIEGFGHALPRRGEVSNDLLVRDYRVIVNVYMNRLANATAYSNVIPNAKAIEGLLTVGHGEGSQIVKAWRNVVNGVLGKQGMTEVVVETTMDRVGDFLRENMGAPGRGLARYFPMLASGQEARTFYRATNKFVISALGKPSSVVKNSSQPLLGSGIGGNIMREEAIKAYADLNIAKGGIFTQPDMIRAMTARLPRQPRRGFFMDEGQLRMTKVEGLSPIEKMLVDADIRVEYLPELLEARGAFNRLGKVAQNIDEYAEFSLTGFRTQDLVNRAIDFKTYVNTFRRAAQELRDGNLTVNQFFDEIALEFFHPVEVRRFVRMFGDGTGNVEPAMKHLARRFVSHKEFDYGRGMGPGLMRGYIGGMFRFGSWGFYYANLMRRIATGQSTRIRVNPKAGNIERVLVRPFGILPENWARMSPQLKRLNAGKKVDLTSHREDLKAAAQLVHYLGAGALIMGLATYGVGAWRPQDWAFAGPAPDPELFDPTNMIVLKTMGSILEAQFMLPALAAGELSGISDRGAFIEQLKKSYKELSRVSGPHSAASRAVLAFLRYVQQTPLDVPGSKRREPTDVAEMLRGILLNAEAETVRSRGASRVRARARRQAEVRLDGGPTWFDRALADPWRNSMNAIDERAFHFDRRGVEREALGQARAARRKELKSESRESRKSIGQRLLEEVTRIKVGGRGR